LFDQVGFRYSTLFVITTNALLVHILSFECVLFVKNIFTNLAMIRSKGILVLFFLCCQRRLSPGILAVPEQYQAANYSTLAGEDYGPEDEKSNARAKRESMVSSLKDGIANPEWMTSEQSI
jgi:hypothetical protein